MQKVTLFQKHEFRVQIFHASLQLWPVAIKHDNEKTVKRSNFQFQLEKIVVIDK